MIIFFNIVFLEAALGFYKTAHLNILFSNIETKTEGKISTNVINKPFFYNILTICILKREELMISYKLLSFTINIQECALYNDFKFKMKSLFNLFLCIHLSLLMFEFQRVYLTVVNLKLNKVLYSNKLNFELANCSFTSMHVNPRN